MDPGPGALVRQSRDGLPDGGTARVPVHDDHRVRASETVRRPARGVVPGPGGPPGRSPDALGIPVRFSATVPHTHIHATAGGALRRHLRVVVLQAPQEFVGACRGLFAVVGEEETAVLAVSGAQMREPAEPGPLGGALLGGTRAVRADQDDLQGLRRVQRRELGHHRAGQPREPRARPRQPQRPDLAEPGGHRYGGQQPRAVGGRAVRRTEPDRERLRVSRAALPEPGAGAQGSEQQRRRVGPALRGLWEGVRELRGRRAGLRPLVVVLPVLPALGRLLLPAPAGQAACPLGEPAAPAHTLWDVRPPEGRPLAPAACGRGGIRVRVRVRFVVSVCPRCGGGAGRPSSHGEPGAVRVPAGT